MTLQKLEGNDPTAEASLKISQSYGLNLVIKIIWMNVNEYDLDFVETWGRTECDDPTTEDDQRVHIASDHGATDEETILYDTGRRLGGHRNGTSLNMTFNRTWMSQNVTWIENFTRF